MDALLPGFFLAFAGVALVLALLAFWQSLRAVFGAIEVEGVSDFDPTDARRSLLEEKNTLLRSLKDIEFEREIGKISPEDYDRLEAKLRGRAREVLRLLDEDAEPFRAEAERLVADRVESSRAAVEKESAS